MFSLRSLGAAALLASLPLVFAQTYTDCSPLQKTCPSDAGLASGLMTTDFTSGHDGWSSVNSGVTYGSSGALFTITGDGQAPTIQTDNYIFFGRVDVVMKSSPGVGIVSSIVLQSDDLDEIDWEFLGGDATHVQTNFFGKGDTSSYDRVTYVPTANSQSDYHTYSIDWTSDRIQWLIDGAVVRTLAYSDALASGGKLFPQTPARVKLGNWVGGGANNAPGTVSWAGGKTDFSAAPFVMNIKSVSITNYNPASSYTYSDMSGSWQSIVSSGSIQKGATPPVVSSPLAAAPVLPSSAAQNLASSAAPIIVSTSAVPIIISTTATQSSTSTSVTTGTTSTSVIVVPPPVSKTTLLTSSTPIVSSTGILTSATQSQSSSSTVSSSARASYTGAASQLQVGAGSLLGVAAAMLLL